MIGQLQSLVESWGSSDSDFKYIDAIIQQMVPELTVLNGGILIVTVVAVGAACYCCSKRLKLCDSTMYATQTEMENAASTVTENLEQVNEEIHALRADLTSRLDPMRDKMKSLIQIQQETQAKIADSNTSMLDSKVHLSQIRTSVGSSDFVNSVLSLLLDSARGGNFELLLHSPRGENEEVPKHLEDELKRWGNRFLEDSEQSTGS